MTMADRDTAAANRARMRAEARKYYAQAADAADVAARNAEARGDRKAARRFRTQARSLRQAAGR
jgi:hypothetical protein